VRKLVLSTVCLLAAIGCRRAPEKPAPTPKTLTTVRMNFTPSVSFAPFVIAKEEGYFEEEGIDAKIEVMEINSALLGIVSRQTDVFAGPMRPGIFNLIVRGEKVAIVADKGHSAPGCQADAFVAPPAMARRIALRGFRGEKFTAGRGGYTEYLIDRLLARERLERSAIVSMNMPGGGDFLDPDRMKIEAVRYLTEPNLTNALENGLAVVASPEELVPGHQISVIVFGPRLLQDDPKLGQRFMRAYLKAVRQYNAGKTDRNVGIISKYTKLPEKLIRKGCWQPIATDGRVDAAALQDFVDWGRKYKYIEGELPREVLWDSRFVDAAAAR
jgi:NitT/TauT family transport system substrate-binding protein